MYRPLTIPMPDASWGVRQDMTRAGFSSALTAEDLALDPERVLMRGTVHDGLAAAIVDAEESDKRDKISERQDPRSWEVARERRAFWDAAASYVHPPMPRDVSTGPGAWTWPEPDIVPHTAAQDVGRRDASAPFVTLHQPLDATYPPASLKRPIRMQANHAQSGCVSCGSALRCACAAQYYPPPPQPQQAETMTRPEDDESSNFMVGFYAPGQGAATTAGAARMHNRNAARGGRAVAGGFGKTVGAALRTGLPTNTEALVYGQEPSSTSYVSFPVTYSTGGAYPSGANPAGAYPSGAYPAGANPTGQGMLTAGQGLPPSEAALIYGQGAPSGIPAYDTPHLSPAVMGVPNRYGLSKMPGMPDTTTELMRRDAAGQGIVDPFAPLAADQRVPFTDALGFRFADRGQFAFNVPKFFPARDPIDKLLYEKAASVAPDMAADLSDFSALRGMDNMIEPLSSRYEMMREIAKDMTHTRDPYMVPRTGPSVMHPGRAAQPPEWYVKPGASRARRW